MPRNQFIEGTRLLNGEVIVTVAGKLLDPVPSQAVCNHSRAGFAWGYGGSGPAQLALVIHEPGGAPARSGALLPALQVGLHQPAASHAF